MTGYKEDFLITEGCPDVIILRGSTYEMGYQYGVKYAEKWARYDKLIKASVFGTPFTTALYGYVPPTPEKARKDMQALLYIAEKYCPGYVDWIKGLQKGLAKEGFELDIEDILMVATYPDERWARPGGNYPAGFAGEALKEGTTLARPYCNGFAASGDAVKNNEIIIGVSGSPSDETVDRVIVLAYKDDGSFYSTFGTIPNPFGQSGITSRGFAFALTSNTSDVDCDWGMSPELATFYFASDCESAEAAKEWLKSVPRSFAVGNFSFADDKGDICVCETNNAHFHIRKPGDVGEEGNYVVSTNHFAAKETFEFNVPEMESWKEDSICRLATLSKLLKQGVDQGGVDMEWVHHVLRQNDWYDPETGEWHYNEPASGKGSDVLEYTHSAFYNLAAMEANYMQGPGGGIGCPAGSMGEFVHICLKEDVADTVELMMMDAFFGCYHTARGEYIRIRNNSKVLRQDYASQAKLIELLDDSYRNYERALYVWADAYEEKEEKGDMYFNKLAETIHYLGKTQLYAKKLMSQLKYYEE